MTDTPRLRTERLALDPLRVEDAPDLVVALADPELYRVIGGEPPSVERLRTRFGAMLAGPDDADEEWHNWTVRLHAGTAVGTLQATVTPSERLAALAWVVGTPWQRTGYATEAARAVADALTDRGVHRLVAHVAPGHTPSETVAARIGLTPTGRLDDDGEQVWEAVRLPSRP